MIKTTSLELSKKLKDAGAKQESDGFWVRRGEKWKLYFRATGPARMVGYAGIEEIVASFDCHELLEALPLLTHVWQVEEGEFMSLYKSPEKIKFIADTPAEALGELRLWCLENRRCCEHEWIDATNEHCSGTEVCLKCGAIRAMQNGKEGVHENDAQ